MHRPRMNEKEYELWEKIKDGKIDTPDLEFIAQQSKSLQKTRDLLRITKKITRESDRVYNAMEAIGESIVASFKKSHLHTPTIAHKSAEKFGGVLQLSDLHLNELVRAIDEVGNEYDFTIASQRLYEYIQKSVVMFKAFGVTDILLAMTGDMMNSDRRTDELLQKSASKADAYFIALDLISQVVLDLNQNGFNIHIASVSGNESRFDFEFSFVEFKLTENWDYMIFQGLKQMFKDKAGISFADLNPAGDVVEFFGTKFYLFHGMNVKGDKQKIIQGINGKQYYKGKPFDYALCGHYHSANIGDLYARSSSLVGGNVFSDKGMNLYSRASQNIFITKDKTVHAMKIDLQNADGDYYKFDTNLEAYNTKSYKKIAKEETIIRIVV